MRDLDELVTKLNAKRTKVSDHWKAVNDGMRKIKVEADVKIEANGFEMTTLIFSRYCREWQITVEFQDGTEKIVSECSIEEKVFLMRHEQTLINKVIENADSLIKKIDTLLPSDQ